MKEKQIKVGDFVNYYEAGYRYTNELNSYGDLEVEDWSIEAYGRVIAIFGSQMLVLFHSKINDDFVDIWTIRVGEMHVAWVDSSNLSLTHLQPTEFVFEF